MAESKSKNSHAVMSSSLAKALIEAGVRHYDSGGVAQVAGANAQVPGNVSGGDIAQTFPGAGAFAGVPQQQQDPHATTQPTNNFNGGDFAQHWATVNVPAMMQDFGNIGKDLGASFTAQNQYQAGAPPIATQQFGGVIDAMRTRQQNNYAQQQLLANALLTQSQGLGQNQTAPPSVAQAMLAQQTGNNAAQQGALMASQRGAGANPGMIARQAAQQGGAMQQQSVGQAAALKAQEQLGAQQALMQQQQNMSNAALQGESIQQGALASQNAAITQGSLGAQGINANVAGQNAAATNSTFGGMLGGAGSLLGLNEGGQVPLMGIQKYSEPGDYTPPKMPEPKGGEDLKKGMKGLGKFLSMDNGGVVPGKAEKSGDAVANDKVPALLSPGEVVLPRSVLQGPEMEKKVLEFLKHLKIEKKGYGGVMEARKEKKMHCGGKV